MSGHARRWLPAAVVVLAIAATAIAARRPGSLNPGTGDGLWENVRPAVALGAVVLLAVVATNYAKHRDDGYGVLHRAGTATAVLLTAAAVLTPIGLLFFGRQPGHPEAPPVDNGPGGSQRSMPGMTMNPPSQGKPRQGKSFAEWIVLGVLALIGAAVVALLIYVLIRLLSRLRVLREAVPLIDFEPLNPEFEQLAEAVAAGAEALEYEGDAREAVIACYSAMERAVSGGGGRRATDTPEEFLRRVTAANLIPEGPARRLTELFREARFSRHPIAEGQRDAAREALRTISDHLQARMDAVASAPADGRA